MEKSWSVLRLSDGKYSVRFLGEERWILPTLPVPPGLSTWEEQKYEAQTRAFFEEIERMLNSGIDKTEAIPRTLLDGPPCQY